MHSAIEMLLDLIDQAFDHKAWHGPNLRGSIRLVDAPTAAWRPGTQRRCIWEIVVHAAYWKYAVRRRLLGEKRGSFPLKGSNWFPRPARLSQEEWHEAVGLLDDMHRSVRTAIADFPASRLGQTVGGSRYTNLETIHGVAAHDLYHAGQIQLLKRLAHAFTDGRA